MILWAITEIGFDALLIFVLVSNWAAKFRRVVCYIFAFIVFLDLVGVIDYTVWKFLTKTF